VYSLVALSLSGCIPFTSFQSARMVPRHTTQATLSAAWTDFQTDEGVPAGWIYLDGHLRSGIASRADASLGLTAMLQYATGGLGGALDGDIRGSIWKNHLAVVLPASIVLGDASFASSQLQPGVIITVPVGERWDISVAARRHLFLGSLDAKPRWSYDVGAGIPLRHEGWTLRPEVGLLVDGPADDRYFHVGVGLQVPAP
jgi:hypothetical protein